MRRQLCGLTIFAAAALVLAACATMRVSSHVERGLDFTRYRTFDWGPADALPTGDPRLDRDPFFQDRVEGAVEKQMAVHGLTRAARGTTPDIRIHYHASIDKRLDVNAADRRHGLCEAGACGSITEYDAGTLVVDVLDARTNRLIWRGWAQESIAGVLDNRDRLASQIDRGVTGMFARFPAAGEAVKGGVR